MTLPKIKKALRGHLLESGYSRTVWQKRPWTMVEVILEFNGETWRDVGFSKANWPDKWNGEYGADLATKKAIADIARQIVDRALLRGEIGPGQWSSYFAGLGLLDVVSAISD